MMTNIFLQATIALLTLTLQGAGSMLGFLGQVGVTTTAAVGTKYTVRLEQSNISPSETKPPLNYDFDGDGVIDTVAPYGFYFSNLTITLSKTGQNVTIAPVSAGTAFNGVSAVSFNADKSYPSLVFATYNFASTRQPTGFDYAKQVIAINNQGTFTVKELPLNVIGRDVSCTRGFPGRPNPVCFFASYWDYVGHLGPSKLVVVRPDATILDITKAAGLPFPVRIIGNGTWMISAGMFDVTGDGLPDLVAGGQHSKILVAKTKATGKMVYQWFGNKAWENMRIFTPMASDMPVKNMPSCVYAGMEPGQGQSDFILCYNRSSGAWYTVPLPVVSWSYERPVRFWELNGKVVFAATDAQGVLNLFSISK